MNKEIALVSSKKFVPTRTGLVITADATDEEVEAAARSKNMIFSADAIEYVKEKEIESGRKLGIKVFG